MIKIMKNNKIKKIIHKLTVLLMTFIALLSLINPVYADDNDENDFENDNIENEIKIEKENNMLCTSKQENQKPILNSRKYIILDRKSELSIYGKDENKKTAMASTTKIMTRYSSFRKLQKPR